MRRAVRLFIAALWAAVATVNVLAFMQARALTRFVGGGEPTPPPTKLSWFDRAAAMVSGVRVARPRNPITPSALGLAFETFRFPSDSGATVEAWHIPGKHERLVVALFHGYATSKSAL